MNALYSGSLIIKISYFHIEKSNKSGVELKWLTVFMFVINQKFVKMAVSITNQK